MSLERTSYGHLTVPHPITARRGAVRGCGVMRRRSRVLTLLAPANGLSRTCHHMIVSDSARVKTPHARVLTAFPLWVEFFPI